MKKGFTIVELVVVTSIIALMSTLVMANYRVGGKTLALQRSAYKLTQDLRGAQEMAMSAQEVSGSVPYGFGIYFDQTSPEYYKLFADLDGDKAWDGEGENIEIFQLEKEVQISGLSPTSAFSIVFTPPDPIVWINGVSSGAESRINLSLKDGSGEQRTVFINTAGLITIE